MNPALSKSGKLTKAVAVNHRLRLCQSCSNHQTAISKGAVFTDWLTVDEIMPFSFALGGKYEKFQQGLLSV